MLRKAGRQRNLQARAEEISTALRAEHLGLPDALTEAYGVSVRSLVAVLTTMVTPAAALEGEVERCSGQHPDAEIITSQLGLGVVLGARVLAEFGDDKNRYADAEARRNYAGTSPHHQDLGQSKVVLARYARTKRLADAMPQQAFSALSSSPGARAFYDQHHARGATHNQPPAPCPTASSASSTAAYATERPTTRPPPGPTDNPGQLDDFRPWDIWAGRSRALARRVASRT